jgi:hypothetical protein
MSSDNLVDKKYTISTAIDSAGWMKAEWDKILKQEVWTSPAWDGLLWGIDDTMKGIVPVKYNASNRTQELEEGDRVCFKEGYEHAGEKATYIGKSVEYAGRCILRNKSGDDWEFISDAFQYCPLTVKEIRKKYHLTKKQYRGIVEAIKEVPREVC